MNFIEDELEYERKYQVKPVIKECIYELLERFWILREEDEQLFYQIKDNEVEVKRYFRDTFRFRLVSNHEMIKLEKIPVVTHSWMGEKSAKSVPVFKTQIDYAFFFWILAFLEGKTQDQQFTLQNICEYLQVQEDGNIEWKDGIGYQNRLSLVRTMKYAVKMNLIKVIDLDIDDFAGNDNHDVLLERTLYSSYFMRNFQEDVTTWSSLNDFVTYLNKENYEMAERKHRFYRRLFLEPIVYHDELIDEDQDYIRNYYSSIDNNIYRNTEYTYERYRNASMLVKSETSMGEKIFPAENMNVKLILSFGNYIFQRPFAYPFNSDNQIELIKAEVDNIISDLSKEHRQFWSKSLKQKKVEEIREEIVADMQKWNLLEEGDNETFIIKDGAFRFVGDYYETH